MNKLPLVMALAAGLFVAACTKDDDKKYDCTGLTPTYNADIKPILDQNCALSGCHDSVTKESGKDFSSYATAKPLSQEDDFLGSVEHRSGFASMPRNAPKLSDATLKQLQCWVQNGSPE